jgi:predicted acetyltransferase
MKKNEVPISVLYPFSVSFYRKYGWEQFDEMIEHHLNPSSINKKLPSETYEIVHEKEPNEEMMRYYNCYAARHYNMVQKEQIQWSFDLVMLFKGDVDRQVVALKKDGEMKGLFILKYLNRDDRDTVVIDSICYDNRDVLNAMMKFIATLSLQCSRLKINLPQDLDVWPFLTERPKESLVRQRSMIRVVDVMGLNGLEINMPDCEFNLKINDAFAEWNDDVFKLSVREGFLSIEKSEQADMTCDINAFSSIISGHTNFNEMIAMGKVQLLDGYTLEQDFPKTITMLGYGF